MTDWNETDYREIDFLPREDDNTADYREESGINQTPHTKRQCDPMYVCPYHGDPEAGT